LGRVDNSIVREPGTRIPKIPGTSLHGAIRSYAAYLNGTPEAAGQKHDDLRVKGDINKNPVCYAFGYIAKAKNGSDEVTAYSGVVNIFDAQVLLFPVYSMEGPVWVTTIGRLRAAGFTFNNSEETQEQPEKEKIWATWDRDESLNLGWLMVDVKGKIQISPPSEWEEDERWKAIRDRIVVVHESLFAHVVNSNLEVRTSVSINPKTGAAEEGALFTYEALPRATFLTMEVVVDDYRKGWKVDFLCEELKKHLIRKKDSPICLVEAGLRMIEYLGVGGMGTRGFGRVAMIGEPIDEVVPHSTSVPNSGE
ncbi:MAG: type III-B CRISPR module RAMP protein Cmr4, partial [Bacteroidetes bacterium]